MILFSIPYMQDCMSYRWWVHVMLTCYSKFQVLCFIFWFHKKEFECDTNRAFNWSCLPFLNVNFFWYDLNCHIQWQQQSQRGLRGEAGRAIHSFMPQSVNTIYNIFPNGINNKKEWLLWFPLPLLFSHFFVFLLK